MRTPLTLCIVLLFGNIIAQNLDNYQFGSTDKLDIITWNIQDFPKNGVETIESVEKIIKALDADIIALQEATDTKALQEIVNKIEACEAYYESYWYGGLAYIYNSNTIEVKSAYEIFTAQEYRIPFPRSPLIVEFVYKGEDYVVINNHLKCCGDNYLDETNAHDHESRRKEAVTMLKGYVEESLPSEKVFILGTFNDLITDEMDNNIFSPVINDPDNFMIANGNISEEQSQSLNTSMDHIIISNELFSEYNNENSFVEMIDISPYFSGGMESFKSMVSDHLPIGISLSSESPTSVEDESFKEDFEIYPNPAKNGIRINTNNLLGNAILKIYDNSGKCVYTKDVMGKFNNHFDVSNLPSGFYYADLISTSQVFEVKKLIITD